MANISELPAELLIKILSFLPTKVAISTSVLSERWKFLWMWLPKIEYIIDLSTSKPGVRDFINKNLPIHRAPVIESLCIKFDFVSLIKREDIKKWVQIAVSRGVRELHLDVDQSNPSNHYSCAFLPRSMYSCKSLVSLKLDHNIFVDVPPMGFLPSLKTLQLVHVKYSNKDTLGLLLSYCPVLEDLNIERLMDNNMRSLVVTVPSLQRLSLNTERMCSSDEYVIVTPSLKYFKVRDRRNRFSYLIEDMPKLEEADINVSGDIEKFLESITSVKRLSLRIHWEVRNSLPIFWESRKEPVDGTGTVFNQLEHLKLYIHTINWSELVIRLLKDSPKLRVLNLSVFGYVQLGQYRSVIWNNVHTSVPECLLKSLESFTFEGYKEKPEVRDFLNFLSKYACCLKSSSISWKRSISCCI